MTYTKEDLEMARRFGNSIKIESQEDKYWGDRSRGKPDREEGKTRYVPIESSEPSVVVMGKGTGDTKAYSGGGSTRKGVGNVYYHSDGSSTRKGVGDMWYHSDGSSTRKGVGDVWYHSP
ncbi:hypothetical protein [Roseimicrobium gellanilyticum]|nr:hypothetical protein [Roseimicrobium gellanilyticum]